jgi:NAD(P)-dependent dehydrogenase (short-subunit alcohol dehydrogenase family)
MSGTGQKVGGSQGIGAGVVDGYRQRRWAVVTNSRHIKPSKDPDVLTVEGDISGRATADQIISPAMDRFGRVDTLVNNAGVFILYPPGKPATAPPVPDGWPAGDSVVRPGPGQRCDIGRLAPPDLAPPDLTETARAP